MSAAAERPLQGGIIAAGDGTRLRRAGFAMPKPLVPVAGVPLIESTIRNFIAAGVERLVVIVNERERECVEWVHRRFPSVDVRFIVKTTASSLESFTTVTRACPPGRTLMSTVDAWCRPADFVRFVDAARRRPEDATVLAVTPLVADEAPLWVACDGDGRITRIGGHEGDMATAGLYLISERVRATAPAPHLGRLREFLGWLAERGEPMYGEVVADVVDVDDAEDVALAEALADAAAHS